MRPDMEDYDDMDEESPRVHSRAMSWVVLAVAVGGFAALAYYAYHSGAQTTADGMLVVEADASPIKSAPEDAAGEQFPNQEKTIYEAIAPERAATTEKLMPEPERPLAATNVEDSEDSAPVVTPSAATLAAVAEPELKPETATNKPAEVVVKTPEQAEKPAVTAVVTAPVEKPLATANEAEASFANPKIINEKKPEVKAEPKKEASPAKAPASEKPKAKPAVKPAATGGAAMVQLGAYKSEAEAQASWKKISSAHSSVIKGAPIIVKAETDKGTFYRLRAGGFASVEQARSACASLSAKGQACFPVAK